ncbi:DUF1707 domain-containing protein [Streptomyces sp. CRN 30]|uniref:DUF1707 SHOCT-like domain-containing protein n=1 Tax=Streptomyces sp. CRN 30 TaxID=3075613 RepID=UPI002A804F32|nr:DUF1707 domain-containing protein [Streptomyces sp. CRN 30]
MSGEISPAGAHPGGGSVPELRASHADRDRVVDVLRVAAGDGRLTAAELDERLEAALSARTLTELGRLTADLPPSGAVVPEAKDVVRIEQAHSPVTRTGRWVVPRRLELNTAWCETTLDFTEAVITRDILRIAVNASGKTLTLITKPGVVVDTDGLNLVFGKVKAKEAPDPDAPVVLRVELTGQLLHGRVVVRGPRRPLGRRLLGRP